MTKQIINIGSGELKGDGESLRSAFSKVNANFDEVYSDRLGNLSITGTNLQSIVGTASNSDISIIPNGTGTVRVSTLSVSNTLNFTDNTLQSTAFTKSSQAFNPQFTDSSGTVIGVVSTGTYLLIDKLCYFSVYLDFASCTNFGNSQYQISLPFPSATTITCRGGSLHQTTSSSIYHIAGITDIDISNTVHKLYYTGSTTDLAWKYNTPVSATSTSSHFDLSGVYLIN